MYHLLCLLFKACHAAWAMAESAIAQIVGKANDMLTVQLSSFGHPEKIK
jgi:hypothetical protein